MILLIIIAVFALCYGFGYLLAVAFCKNPANRAGTAILLAIGLFCVVGGIAFAGCLYAMRGL
jgi:ABC-type glucose/galactose transport system permease subunit